MSGATKKDQPDACHNLKENIMKPRTHSSLLTRSIAPNRNFTCVRWRRVFLLIPLAVIGVFAYPSPVRAICENGCDFNNTYLGESALLNYTTGFANTAVGYLALYTDTTGYGNSATGNEALSANTVGIFNTAAGSGALTYNTTGSYNTASGAGALYVNSTASYNTADGFEALHGNTTGSSNTATGYHALYTNTTGGFNVASGGFALFSNTIGNSNTAIGYDALYSNENGMNNTATGVETLVRNTTGSSNTALGFFALINNSIGNNNIAVGEYAGSNLTTGSNNIDIGNLGVAGESRTIRVGIQGTQNKTFIAGISGATVPGGVGVIVGTNGKLGTVVSSERFKEEIKPMNKASEAILALKPVTFHYKKEFDPESAPQFGLIAEDVAKIDRDLVAFDEEGKPYTVRYEAVNAMLLNEFLKEHRKVAALEAKIAQQESTNSDQQKVIQALTASLKEQAAEIRRVDAQVELNKPAAHLVLNDQ